MPEPKVGIIVTPQQMVTALATLQALSWTPDTLPESRRDPHLPYRPYVHFMQAQDDGVEVAFCDISATPALDDVPDGMLCCWIMDDGRLVDFDEFGEEFELAIAQHESRTADGHRYRATLLKVEPVGDEGDAIISAR